MDHDCFDHNCTERHCHEHNHHNHSHNAIGPQCSGAPAQGHKCDICGHHHHHHDHHDHHHGHHHHHPRCPFPPRPIPLAHPIDGPCDIPVLFHTVTLPANMGDDIETPPECFDYRNVILVYQANDNVYIYSSDGIPTQIASGAALEIGEKLDEIEELVGKAEEIAEDIEQIKESVEQIQILDGQVNELNTKTDELSNTTTELQNNVANLQSDVAAAQQNIANEQANREQAINEINNKLSVTVQTDTTVTGDQSTVTITKTTGRLGETGTQTGMPLPVASESQAGVISPSTYNKIQDVAEKIQVILEGTAFDPNLPASPSDEQLSDAWKKATGKDTVINGAKITGPDGKTYIYYENTGTWQEYSEGGGSIIIEQFTNEQAGTIKGADVDGKVFAETDGTGSVKGWDTLKAQVGTNTSEIESLEARVYTVEDTLDKIDGEIPDVVQTTGQSETDVMSQKAVTDELEGLRGNLPTVVQTTGESTTDVMSQKAVTDLVGNVESVLATINTGAGV